MKLREIVKALDLKILVQGESMGREITNAYVSDLLSDVIGQSREGELWITLQAHLNIVAVAVMKDLPGIILIHSRVPEEKVLKKAKDEGIALLTSPLSAFELAGRLYNLLKTESG